MAAPCDYPNCREVATTVVVVELGRGSVERIVCSTHVEQAQTIAKQHGGFAYRLVSGLSDCPPPLKAQ
jgi:hypothetical protein